jgi:hypothetical protein
MIARLLPVIPLICTGVPITQPEKITLMYKSVFLIFKQKLKYFSYQFQFRYLKI